MTLFVVEKPLLANIEVRHSCRWSPEAVTHISGGILFHSSVQILFKSLMFQGCRLATWGFSSLHRFSLGLLISWDWLGYTMTLMCSSFNHSFVVSARRFGSSSCWNTHPPPMFSVLAEGRRYSSKIYSTWVLSIGPAMEWSRPVLLAEKQSQSLMFPPPCLTVGTVLLGS